MKRTRWLAAVLTLIVARVAATQEDAGRFEGLLQGLRDPAKQVGAKMLDRLGSRRVSESKTAHRLVDGLGPATPSPRQRLPGYETIDVNAVNDALAAGKVNAAIYQVVPGPGGQVPNTSPFAVVFKDNSSAPLPFSVREKVRELKVIGSVLVVDSDEARRYWELGGGKMEPVGAFLRTGPGLISSVKRPRTLEHGYRVMEDVLGHRFDPPAAAGIFERLLSLHHRNGLGDYEISDEPDGLVVTFKNTPQERIRLTHKQN